MKEQRQKIQLINAATGSVLIDSVELATTFWRRFRGWQCRRLPSGNSGILIAPCNSVHTCWMRFAIDVAFVNAQGVVVQIAADLPPWRAVWKVRNAVTVLETPSGRCLIEIGMRLKLAAPRDLVLPRSLQSWAC